MPLTYRTPGVYVEWQDVNPQRLEIGRTDVAGFVGLAERGPVQVPVKIESTRQFVTTFGERLAHAYLGYSVAGFFENGGRTCWVVRAADPDHAVPARLRIHIPGRPLFVLEATSPGTWGNDIVVEPVWGRDRITHLTVVTRDGRTRSLDLDAALTPRAAGSEIRTNLLGVADEDLPDLFEDPIVKLVPDSVWVPCVELGTGTATARLSGGEDGIATLSTRHFTGHPDHESKWGVAELERVDLVSFVSVPDLMMGQEPEPVDLPFHGFTREQVFDAQLEVVGSCMRMRDRIALLDMPASSASAALQYRTGWPTTSFAALYHPWILVNDPLRVRATVRTIPPSGHVAGMFARTDRLRGVHKPPANEILEGVWDLRETIDDDLHGELNERAINAIRVIPGRGVLVLGARTLDADIRWRYVNIRRLFSMIEESLQEGMQWLAFEPNNPQLWQEVDRSVRGFLEQLFRIGMLDGATSEDAYFVRCDATTNPAEETDLGRVTCVIGIQPPYPAEFVIVRIGVTRSGIQIQERGAQDV